MIKHQCNLNYINDSNRNTAAYHQMVIKKIWLYFGAVRSLFSLHLRYTSFEHKANIME